MKNIVILGSTGSIGKMTLEVLDHLKEYRVLGLAANGNTELLKSQILKCKPKFVAISDEKKYSEFLKTEKFFIEQNDVTIFGGEAGLVDILDIDGIDFILVAVVGAIGLLSISKAIQRGLKVAVANKEPLVIAGEFLMQECKKHSTQIIPVDSEHSAIFQCLLGENRSEVKRIILTASGGPFYNKSCYDLKNVTVEEALAHPRWKMGRKITIDSATMMNKGFEVIEAHYLFGMPAENIDVIIHRESVIHSMVEFIDGSVKAHLGETDMKIPIQFALTYPKRVLASNERFDFAKLKSLNFEDVDFAKFKCLKLAYECLKNGQDYHVVLNAANEVLVEKFLNEEIRFLDIQNKLNEILVKHKSQKLNDIYDVIALDKETRKKVSREISRF